MKKISVILPSYNYAGELPRSIESVLAQTVSDWELIIVDDGSTDGSAEVIRAYVGKYPDKIRFFQHEGGINKGLSTTYRLGISKAEGEYVALLEADDYWRKDSLALRAGILERHPEVSVAYTGVEMFGDDKIIRNTLKDIQSWQLPEEEITDRPYDAFGYLLDENLVLTCSVFMTRKRLLDEVNFISPYDAWFDWWVLAQLSLCGKFYKCPEKATFWQLSSKSYLRQFNKRINLYRESRFFLRHLSSLMSDFLNSLAVHEERPEHVLLRKEIEKRQLRQALFHIEGILRIPVYRIWISVSKLSGMVKIPIKAPLRRFYKWGEKRSSLIRFLGSIYKKQKRRWAEHHKTN
ncbi:MAG: glycosyltransferase family 2 protein [Deltaproteobacteria bacterium]